MTCTSPVSGYKSRLGGFTTSRPLAYLDQEMQVPCGSCISCRLEQSRQWAVRCMHEAEMHEDNCFITLTYRDEDLPLDRSVDYDTIRKFFKRLRKRYVPLNPWSKVKSPERWHDWMVEFGIRKFYCGEYGDETARPHYHALLFNHDFKDKKFWKMSKKGEKLYTSAELESLWPYGFCSVGSVSFQSARYVASYVTKKVKAKGEYTCVRFDSSLNRFRKVKPEFGNMSRVPGIGGRWIAKWKDQVYPRDEVICDGKSVRPPRYYDEAYREYGRREAGEDDRSLSEPIGAVKGRRAREAAKYESEQTAERRAVRDEVVRARLKTYKRNVV